MRIGRSLPAAAALVLVPLFGCATISNGNHQTIHVETDPPGATVTALGEPHTSPVDLEIPRKAKDVEVVVEKDGFVTRRIPLVRKPSDKKWWNFLWVPVGAGAGAASASSSPGWFEPTPGEAAGAGAVAGALVAGTAFLIDGSSGANWRFEPESIVVKLQPAPPPPAKAAAASNP